METKPTPSVAETLIATLYERMTGYRPAPFKMAHDGENIHVWGYVKDLPVGYRQVGAITLYQEEPGGQSEIVGDQLVMKNIPAMWFDVFPLAALNGVRIIDNYRLPDGRF